MVLPRKFIDSSYLEGDFEKVKSLLEGKPFKDPKITLSQSDSAFRWKYLGVIYASDGNTRERGRGFLFKMLQIDSCGSLAGLFVSESVENILREERKRLVSLRLGDGKPVPDCPDVTLYDWAKRETPGNPPITAVPPEAQGTGIARTRSGSRWKTAGYVGAGILAVGTAGIIYHFASEKEPEGPRTKIPSVSN
jgi:hypothetical protein